MNYTYSKDRNYRYNNDQCPQCGAAIRARDVRRSESIAGGWYRDRETPHAGVETDLTKPHCSRCLAPASHASKIDQTTLPPPPLIPSKERNLTGEFIIHVNRDLIAQARKLQRDDIPTLIVRRGSKRWYCRGVDLISVNGQIAGPGIVPQLDCGARTYLRVIGTVRLIDPTTYQHARALLKESAVRAA